jgi:glycosyltransferase involved in cell wall biosynthesis
MEGPTFAVIIPTYNRAALLPPTIASVLSQSYPANELIVVDNCSTDNTEEVLRPLIESGKVRFIRHDRNYERARSRNTGMAHATSEYVTFLDSDDLMYPDNLADAARFVQEHGSPRFFHNLYELIDSSGKRLHRYKFPAMSDPRRAIAEGNFLSCIGVFIAREIYSRFHFDTNPELTGSEDWDFWVRVTAEYLPRRIDKINSAIVHHGGRTVLSVDLEAISRRLALVQAKIAADEKLARVYAPYQANFAAGGLLYVASAANLSRQHRRATALLREALRSHWGVLFWRRFWRIFAVASLRMDKGI